MCEKDWSAKSEKDNGQSISEKNQLINPFTGPPKGPVSPLVTLVRKKPELADLVVEECSYLLNHPDPRLVVLFHVFSFITVSIFQIFVFRLLWRVSTS